jgi:hypothetical protein
MTKRLFRKHDIVQFDLTYAEKLSALRGESQHFTYFCNNPGVCHVEWSESDWVTWINRRGHWIHKGDYYAQQQTTVHTDPSREGSHVNHPRDARS